MYCRLRRGGGCDSRSDGSGELSGRRHTMQKIAYAASNRLPTLLKEEPKIIMAVITNNDQKVPDIPNGIHQLTIKNMRAMRKFFSGKS